MRDVLTWLHISDIHFDPKTEWRDGVTRSALLKHLRDIFSKNESLLPDFIFCTGDIAFGETTASPLCEQYAKAKEFFDEMRVTCGGIDSPLPKERLFIVPGNHDVNRKRINSDAQQTLINWANDASVHVAKINQRFEDRTKEFDDAMNRLEEYKHFIDEYLPHQRDDFGRQHYAKIIEVDGRKIGVAGFNSAWSCAGPEDDRNIWLAANWQFNNACNALAEAKVKIGLIHHPIDWLNLADRDIATRRVAHDFHFWLHGHTHNAWVEAHQSHITIAAGAVGAQQSDEFGINLTSLDFSSMKGKVHLHSTKAGSAGWTISPIEKHAPLGCWEFELPNTMLDKSSYSPKVPSLTLSVEQSQKL